MFRTSGSHPVPRLSGLSWLSVTIPAHVTRFVPSTRSVVFNTVYTDLHVMVEYSAFARLHVLPFCA